jgi:hypothetical protein
MRFHSLLFVPLAAVALTATAALAQEEGSAEFHRHHFGGLLAGSHNSERNGFTTGGDYEFRFVRHFGVMATGEYVGGGFREDLFAFTAVVHPWKGLKLQAGPGFDHELKKKEAAEAGAELMHHDSTRGLFRIGLGYDVEVGRHMTIGPDFALDILKGDKVFVYGITIGFGFSGR